MSCACSGTANQGSMPKGERMSRITWTLHNGFHGCEYAWHSNEYLHSFPGKTGPNGIPVHTSARVPTCIHPQLSSVKLPIARTR